MLKFNFINRVYLTFLLYFSDFYLSMIIYTQTHISQSTAVFFAAVRPTRH